MGGGRPAGQAAEPADVLRQRGHPGSLRAAASAGSTASASAAGLATAAALGVALVPVLGGGLGGALDSGLRPGVATAPAAGAAAPDADEADTTEGTATSAEFRGAAVVVAESPRFNSTTVTPAPRTTTPVATAIIR
ncbi:hypothetical protein GCM10027612_69710 [Microbispora bryophytorum subsp. camponoti]